MVSLLSGQNIMINQSFLFLFTVPLIVRRRCSTSCFASQVPSLLRCTFRRMKHCRPYRAGIPRACCSSVHAREVRLEWLQLAHLNRTRICVVNDTVSFTAGSSCHPFELPFILIGSGIHVRHLYAAHFRRGAVHSTCPVCLTRALPNA